MSGGTEQPAQPVPPDGPWGSLLPDESGFVAFWNDKEPPRLEEVILSLKAWLGVEGAAAGAGGAEETADGTGDSNESDGDDTEEYDDEEEGDDGEADDADDADDGDDAEEEEDDSESPTASRDITGLSARPFDVEEAGSLWGIQLSIPAVRSAIIVWAEPASPLGEQERELLGEEATASPWLIRVQTVLGHATAAEDYFAVVGLLAGALPKVAGVLDVVTSQFFPAKRLQQLFLAKDAVPIDHILWRLGRFDHPAGGAPEKQVSLLSTTGLRRCGMPELELIDLPPGLVQAGVVLLQTLASLLLERHMPAPELPLEIGDNIAVTLRRSSDVAQELPDGWPGSATWRARMVQVGLDHFGEESAVVAAVGSGKTSDAERFPRAVLETIDAGQAVLYISTNEAEADLRRAQATFDTFAMAFASLHRRDHPDWSALAERSFLVQAPLDEATPVPRARAGDADTPVGVSLPQSAPPTDDHVEQVWMEVRSIERAGVRGRLVAAPRSRPAFQAGAEFLIPSTLVTNWRVEFAERAFGPAESEDLLVEVDRLRGLDAGRGHG